MNAIWIAVFGVVCFVMGFRFYSKFIAERIYRLDPDFQTPAHTYRDGVDYVPTKREILFGHHFTSIAGTGPIVFFNRYGGADTEIQSWEFRKHLSLSVCVCF